MKQPYQFFLTEIANNVLTVTINREAVRNALSREALKELATVFTVFSDNPQIKIAVLTGAGNKSFAAGGDLIDFDSIRTREQTENMSSTGRAALSAVRNFPAPVVAALNGTALGGGAELAMACDFRIAASNCRIGFIQGTLGLTTAWGGGVYLIERIGSATALRLLATGEVLDANSALAMSVVDKITEQNETLSDCVNRFIHPMLSQHSQSLRGMKALIIKARVEQETNLAAIETQHFVECWLHDDHWAAAANALKKQ